MDATADAYEVYASRYATRSSATRSGTFYRYDLYGEPDGPVTTGYYFWLVRDAAHTVVIDCGYNEAEAASSAWAARAGSTSSRVAATSCGRASA